MSSNPQPLITSQGQGGTPVETAKNLQKTQQKGEDLGVWCQQQVEKIKRRDYMGYRRRHRRWLTNYLFYEGRQYGEWDEVDGEFIDAIPTKRNNFYIDNHFSWLIDSSQKEWARSKTKLVARALFDSPENSGKARIATDVLAAEQNRLRDPVDHQGEGLTGAMCGVYARYTAFDVTAGNVKGKIPQYQEQQVKLAEGYSQCLDCGMADAQALEQSGYPMDQFGGMAQGPPQMTPDGLPAQLSSQPQAPQPQMQPAPMQASDQQQISAPPMEMPSATMQQPSQGLEQSPLAGTEETGEPQMCPQCGGTNIETVPPVMSTVNQLTGHKEVNAGQTVTWDVDPFQLRVHPRARKGKVKTTPYVLWERELLICEVEAAFPNFDAKKLNPQYNKQETGQRFPRELERSAGNVSDVYWLHRASLVNDEDDTILITQVWQDKVQYQNVVLDIDLQLNNGRSIPAGVPLGEVFPDGMCYIMAGSQLLDAWAENKNNHWVFGCYRVLPTSFWGRGVEDGVQDQKLLNDVYNLVVAYLRYLGSPTGIGNAMSGLDNNDFSGIPGENTWVESWPPEVPLSNAFTFLNPPPMHAEIMAFLEDRKRSIQAKIGSFSNISGAPDVDNSTATGIKIMRESAIALVAMALDIKGQVDQEWGEQLLQLAQENWIFPHPVQISDEYGVAETKWFEGCDIQGELQVSYDKGSVTPRSEIESRMDLEEGLNVLNEAGIPMAPFNESVPPEVRVLIANAFAIPFNADKYRQAERVAKILCDQLIELVQGYAGAAEQAGIPQVAGQPGEVPPAMTFIMEQLPEVQQALQQVPIEALMYDNAAMMGYIKKWFNRDEGLFAPPIVKAVMRARYKEYMQAMIEAAQMEGMAQVQMQAPQAMAAQAQASGQAQSAAAAKGGPPSKGDSKSKTRTAQGAPRGRALEDPNQQ